MSLKLLKLKDMKLSSITFKERTKELFLSVKPYKNGCRCPECQRRGNDLFTTAQEANFKLGNSGYSLKMTIEIDSRQSDHTETLRLPDQQLVRRFPSIASIAALDAALAMTKTAILCDHPSIQELIDMIENGQYVPSHLFIAHNIIDNLDKLRLTVQTYFLHLDSQFAKISDPDFPF